MALQNGGLAYSLSPMTLARTARTGEQSVLAFANKGACSQIENKTAIHFRIEGKVEAVESSVGIAKGRLLAPPFEQPIGTAGKFIRDASGDSYPVAEISAFSRCHLDKVWRACEKRIRPQSWPEFENAAGFVGPRLRIPIRRSGMARIFQGRRIVNRFSPSRMD